MKRRMVLAALGAALLGGVFAGTQARAQQPLTVKIGVLSDMSSLYSDVSGPGAIVAAKMAVQDFDPATSTHTFSIASSPFIEEILIATRIRAHLQ